MSTALIGAGVTAVTHDLALSAKASGVAVAVTLAIVAVLVFITWAPPVLPLLATLAVARRERFDIVGFPLGNRLLYRDADRRWRLAPAASGSELQLIPHDETDLAARLIRVWRVLPIVASAMVLALIPLALLMDGLLPENSVRSLAKILGFLWLATSVITLLNFIREDVRSPRSIGLAIRRDTPFGRGEVVHTAAHRYLYRDVRPREYTASVVTAITERVAVEPTAHILRYLLFRHFMDTEAETELVKQRSAVLGLETHLRSEPVPPNASFVVWYAAYLSPTAEEAERIWGWIVTPEPEFETAQMWLRARIAALRNDPATARTLAQQARAAYREPRRDERTLDFEIDQIDRLLATLPPASETPGTEPSATDPGPG